MRIGIIGYGNLGRGVECAIRQNPDMELVAVFTRRAPESVSILTEGALVCSVDEVEQWKDKIDVSNNTYSHILPPFYTYLLYFTYN